MHATASRDAYRRVWASFQSTPTTADGRHDTPDWRQRDGTFAACILRIPAVAIEPKLGQFRGELGQLEGVRLHPDHFLHVMLQELGFVTNNPSRPDEISAERLEEFAQAAIEPIFSVAPFDLHFGGANAFQDAVFLEIGDAGILSRLHSRLFDLAAHTSVPSFAYLPHCTVAHFDGTADPQDVASVMQPWRDAQFGNLNATEVEVVTLDPAEPYPLLRSYAVIPFRS